MSEAEDQFFKDMEFMLYSFGTVALVMEQTKGSPPTHAELREKAKEFTDRNLTFYDYYEPKEG